jgi:glycine betaine/choline ABC-type transport system substrate-binding protein
LRKKGKTRRKTFAYLLLLIVAAGLVIGCGKKEPNAKITIGSKNFTEQLILGEIMAQAIEAKTDLNVKRVFNLGGTMICHKALVDGDLDIYAEYTGTALTAILKEKTVADPDKAYDHVKESYSSKFKCEWQKPFGFNNTYAITVRGEFAAEKGLKSISDLARTAGDLTAGFTAEFMEREDGYPGLKETYGIAFKATRDMDPSLMYQAIANKNVDVICAFATDGRIAAYNLKMLEDDKLFFPPYYAAPVVRHAALEKHPEIRKALSPLAGLLSDQTMQKLNFEVDNNKREPADVAHDFLKANNLIALTDE